MTPLHPLTELRAWLHATAQRLRAAQQYRPLVRVSVAQDIVADVARVQTAAAAEAYAAEQADLEAIKLLESAATAGFSDADLPAVETAIRHIRRSAAHDRRISETLSA